MEEERMSKLNREQTITYDKKYNQHPWLKGNTEPIPIEKAEGIFFYDFNGKKYYDMSSQLSCVNIGYGNEDVIQAVNDQVKTLPYIAPAYASAPRSELAKMLVELAPDNIAKVFFTCGGSDANEAAINMARTYTGRSKIFSRYRSYHGSTLGSGNLSGDPRRFALEHPAATGFVKFQDPYVYRSDIPFKNDQEASAYYINKIKEQIAYEGAVNIAAIFVESITGANGVIIPPDGYLQGIRKICDENGILLIADEVQSGFCRTGRMFASVYWQEAGVEPDIIATAKSIAAGVPLSAIIARTEVMDAVPAGTIGGTYCGNPLACAASLKTIEIMERDHLAERSCEIGKKVTERYLEMQKKYPVIGDVRGLGGMIGIEFVKDQETKEPDAAFTSDLIQTCAKKGLLVEGAGTYNNVIRFLAPLVMTDEQLAAGLDIFEASIKECLNH